MNKRLASCTKNKNDELYRRWSDRRPPENECHSMHQVPLYGKTMSRGKKNETPVQHLEAIAPLSQYKQGQVTHRQQCSQCSTSAEERLQPSVRPSDQQQAVLFIMNDGFSYNERACNLACWVVGLQARSKKTRRRAVLGTLHSPIEFEDRWKLINSISLSCTQYLFFFQRPCQRQRVLEPLGILTSGAIIRSHSVAFRPAGQRSYRSDRFQSMLNRPREEEKATPVDVAGGKNPRLIIRGS